MSKLKNAAILLSTYNGAQFLPLQLASIVGQTHSNWTLHWRDDGSHDDSVDIMVNFISGEGSGRTQFYPSIGKARLQTTASFFSLLRNAIGGDAEFFAFSDQDDIWFPDKLACGIAAVSLVDPSIPALYCSGHIAVDRELYPIGRSPVIHHSPNFLAALTQNIAQGCTIVLNKSAAKLIAASKEPPSTWHDWWCYLIVAAAGGEIMVDPSATLLYRQHGKNQVGVVSNIPKRGFSAIKRGRLPFIAIIKDHIKALEQQRHLLSTRSVKELSIVSESFNGGYFARISALRMREFRRQTFLEDIVFKLWFILG